MAYVPQQPWIQNLTVHENITFGQAMQLERYEQVVADCELKSDFEMLPAGDRTEIGERVSAYDSSVGWFLFILVI